MVFARLGSDAGLSPGVILAMVQDAQGFMWFGTQDGLDRYDGYELRHFIHRTGDAGTLPDNWVRALARDSAGRLWVGTKGGGLVWRDDGAGQFRPPVPARDQAKLDPDAKILALHVDRGGRLWIATRTAGLMMFDPAHGTSRQFRSVAGDPGSLSDDWVSALAEDQAGTLWVGTASGLDQLDPASGRIVRRGSRLAADGGFKSPVFRVSALTVDAQGLLWIGLESGLARFDSRNDAFALFRHNDGDANSLPEGQIATLLEDSDQRLWIGTPTGLALLDRRSDDFVVLRHDATNPSSLPDSNVTSLYQDRSGLLWIGTQSGGVASWNPRSWSFGHHRFGDEGADEVTSFAVDRTGTLWVGSFGAGVAAIDPRSGAVKRYRRGPNSPVALSDDTVMSMVADERNRVWLGTMNKGIERLDPARGEVTHFDSVAGDAGTLPAAGVMSLLRDMRGRIWVGTHGGGLARIDPDTDQVVRYEHGRTDASGLSSDRATALAEDRLGYIWIGTEGGGLNVLDPTTGKFAHFTHDPADPASLSTNDVCALHLDDHGTIWVGTRGGGLDRVIGTPFARAALHFENLSESEGLPNSTVYGIESDSAGGLWISTNRGLAAVRPADRSVRGFRRSHGLQGDEFNFGAHYRAPDGTLYFGGSNGYNAFQPARLQINDKPPPIVLTQILKLNKPVSAAPEMVRSLDLGFRDSVVTFQFAALDFTGPAENRYAYRLEGFDADWVNADGGRQATYTNLDGGTYVFHVRAANSDGRWNETPMSVRVNVSPPPWATWWARTLYGLAIFAVIFLVWHGQQRRLQREAAYGRRLKTEVDARTAELAERNRDMERANEQLRAASVSDTLTGLGNRRYLHEAMATILGKPIEGEDKRPPARFVLMVIDLDYLKPINDQYGHEGGDAILIQFAQILRREFRAVDLIVRWGGDEFVVLCQNADLATAQTLAERVRASVSKQIFRVGDGIVARTSCSIGFASMPFVAEHPQLLDWEETLSIADVALYQAKRERNMWIGFAGTEKLAQLPSIPAAVAADAAALEKDGGLEVQRRPWNPEETVDRLRSPRRPGA